MIVLVSILHTAVVVATKHLTADS